MASIFISYRRRDGDSYAGRIYDQLVARLGKEQVFMDVDSIGLGVDFVDALNDRLDVCDALVVVIGPRWLGSEPGVNRLDNPDDFVRLEIANALERKILVVPLLVNGATMPGREDLPEDMQALVRRNAKQLLDEHWTVLAPRIYDQILAAIEQSKARRVAKAPRPALETEPVVEAPVAPAADEAALEEPVVVAEPAAQEPAPVADEPAAEETAPAAGSRSWSAGAAQILQLKHPEFGRIGLGAKGISRMAFSPDGTRIATASADDTARVWDAATGHELNCVRHRDDVKDVAFHADGHLIVTAGDDKGVGVWNAVDDDQPIHFTTVRRGVLAVAFKDDGTRIAYATRQNVVTLTIVDQTVRSDVDFKPKVSEGAVRFSADGSRFVRCGWDNTVRLCDVETGEELVAVTHTGLVNAVAISPDGHLIACAGFDKLARVWDVASAEEVCCVAHGKRVDDVAFGPDGSLMATASSDGTARVWDVGTGAEVASLAHDSNVTRVVFGPDGLRIATACLDESARVWEALA